MKKTILAILLIITLSLSFSGCSLDEIGFLDTMNSMMKQTDFTFEGGFTVKMSGFEENPNYVEPEYDDTFPDEFTPPANRLPLGSVLPGVSAKVSFADMLPEIAPTLTGSFTDLFETGGESTISYHGSINKTESKIVLVVDSKDGEGTITPIVKLIIHDRTVYIDKEFLDLYEIEYTNEETIDDVDYAKFTVEELIQSYVANMKANLYDGPMGYPMFDEENSTEEYITGYYEGFFVGEEDGYFDTTTAYDPTGIADQDLGYADGYAAGVISGDNDKIYYDNSLLEMDDMQEAMIAQDMSADTILDTISYEKQPRFDNLLKNLFANYTLSMVKKDGGSKYLIDMSADDMLEAFSSTVLYLMDNETIVKTSLKLFVEEMTDDQMKTLQMDPEDRQMILDEIDAIEFPQGEDLQIAKDDTVSMIGEMKEELNSVFDVNCLLTLEKTGKNSYETSANMNIVTVENDTMPFIFDMEVISTLSINNESSGDIAVDTSMVTIKEKSAQIKLDISDANAVGAGVMISKNQQFGNPTIVLAVKQDDGSYLADLSGLDAGTKYYYKPYTKDATGNLVYSTEIQTFDTLAAADLSAPPTGDSTSPWTVVILILSGLVILAYVLIMKKKQKA